jgi:peptidoglycan-binding protein ArfA
MPPERPLATLQLYFRFGSARLDDAARARLRKAIPQLRQARHLTLVGHTDAIGSASANLRLSQARAEAVRQALAVIAPDLGATVDVAARGACCAADPQDTPAGRARNRRVEILLDAPDPHPP